MKLNVKPTTAARKARTGVKKMRSHKKNRMAKQFSTRDGVKEPEKFEEAVSPPPESSVIVS